MRFAITRAQEKFLFDSPADPCRREKVCIYYAALVLLQISHLIEIGHWPSSKTIKHQLCPTTTLSARYTICPGPFLYTEFSQPISKNLFYILRVGFGYVTATKHGHCEINKRLSTVGAKGASTRSIFPTYLITLSPSSFISWSTCQIFGGRTVAYLAKIDPHRI